MSTGDTMEVSSSNYPLNYPNNVDCLSVFGFVGDDSESVAFVIYVVELNLEDGMDYLYIGNGTEVTDTNTIGQLTKSNSTIVVPGATMWLWFISDDSVVEQGFLVTVEITSNNKGNGNEVNISIIG